MCVLRVSNSHTCLILVPNAVSEGHLKAEMFLLNGVFW